MAGWPGGRVAGRVLDISKIQLTQPSLVELGLRLSLAIIYAQHGCDTALSKTGSIGEEALPNPKASTPKKERSYDTRRMIQKSTVHGRAET